MSFTAFVAASAWAQDAPPPPPPPPPPSQEEIDQLLREAEAEAGAPPPPQPPPRGGANLLNPGITAFGDVVGQVGLGPDGLAPGSTMYLRSAEIELRADVDPFAKAGAVIAFEQEAPDLAGGPAEGFEVGPEEAYIDLVALPARLSLRAGKFKLPFGTVNRTHPHDLPWIDVPPAIELLGEEGLNDTGASVGWLLPLGPAALTLTAGAFSGEAFDEDNLRANIAALGRAELFVGAGNVDIALGGSAYGDPATGDDPLAGVDVTFKWRGSTRQSVVLVGEAFRDAQGELAGYGAVQLQPARIIYLGFREDVGDELVHNLYLSYYTSEFLRVRVGGGFAPSSGTGTALAQLTFVWGAHPVEPWWVNR